MVVNAAPTTQGGGFHGRFREGRSPPLPARSHAVETLDEPAIAFEDLGLRANGRSSSAIATPTGTCAAFTASSS